MNTLHVKTGDTVVVLSGKDKGKEGKVITASPKKGTVIIEGVNLASRHVKPKKQGEQGGIIKKESPIRACKVQRVCPKCHKPTRVKHAVKDGKKVTICSKCAETI